MGQKKYKIVLFSPDKHVIYDGLTPDERGVGGGVTARVRILQALARLGHDVTAYVNCEKHGTYNGVRYIPLSHTKNIDADVFIAISTGGDLDLRPIRDLSLRTQLKIIMIGGVPKPKGIEEIHADFIYVASNFLRDVVVSSWGIEPAKVFVSYNGLEQHYFEQSDEQKPDRDPYAMVFVGHPSKGLEPAISILQQLRASDPRFRLDIFGGAEIWGEISKGIPSLPGVNFRGLLGQKALARELLGYSFALALQTVPEGFGIAVQECKRAGIVVIASAVGAFKELIRHGYDGFLIEGDPNSSETQDKVKKIILELLAQPDYMAFIRRNAQAVPWDWDLTARTWVHHWEMVLGTPGALSDNGMQTLRYSCPFCRESLALFPDGYRCLTCARYYPIINGIPSFAGEPGSYSEIYEPDFRLLITRASQMSWRDAVVSTLGGKSEFLVNYILDEARGFFHYLFDLSEESIVLDLGAGFGAVSCAFARRCRVVALDNHWLRLHFLTERCRQEALSTVIPVHGDALKLPFEPAQFDLVTMIGVLEWAGTWSTEQEPEVLQRRLLQEAYRVLKPGRHLVIGIENRYGARYLMGEPDDHTGIRNITYLPRDEADLVSLLSRGTPYRVRTHSRVDYESLLKEIGFQSVSFYATYPDYRLWSVLVPLDDRHLLEFYLEKLEPKRDPATELQRIAARLGFGGEFVDSYLIIATK